MKKTEYLKSCKDLMEKHFPGEDIAPIGATEEQVQDLERELGHSVADSHRELLLWMGRDYGGILSQEEWFVDQIARLTRALPSLLRSNGITVPTTPYVCCYSHQGYAMAWYSLLDSKGDPETFLFVEADDKHPEPYSVGKFSQWIMDNLMWHNLDIDKQIEAKAKFHAEQAMVPRGQRTV